jgi:hypothetical protein
MIGAAQGSRIASLRPLSGSDELLFTATLDTEVTRIFVANVDPSTSNFRLHHVVAGGTITQENALFYDVLIAPASAPLQVIADAANSGIQLKTGDTLWVRSSTGGRLSINVYGVTTSIAPGAGL